MSGENDDYARRRVERQQWGTSALLMPMTGAQGRQSWTPLVSELAAIVLGALFWWVDERQRSAQTAPSSAGFPAHRPAAMCHCVYFSWPSMLRCLLMWQVCSHLTSTQALVDVLMMSELTSPSDKSEDTVEPQSDCEARRLCQLLTRSFSHSCRSASLHQICRYISLVDCFNQWSLTTLVVQVELLIQCLFVHMWTITCKRNHFWFRYLVWWFEVKFKAQHRGSKFMWREEMSIAVDGWLWIKVDLNIKL